MLSTARTAFPRVLFLAIAALLLQGSAGCVRRPFMLAKSQQEALDRKVVETPADFELRPLVNGLNGPTALCWDADGNLIVAEGGVDGDEPRIFGFKKADGAYFDIYPYNRKIPFIATGFRVYGPIGGMVFHAGRLYVSHRDENDLGVITALGYDGSHTTIEADLPAQGDYGVTDLAIGSNGRLYFGVGTATNSGVVGNDNWQEGWLKRHPQVCDQLFTPAKLQGFRFDTPDPRAGLFGPSEKAVTSPAQPYGVSNQSRIQRAANGKPNGAVCSVSLSGGDFRVEAFGIHNPRGLAFNEYSFLFMVNGGMEMRGTRPVKDDPDSMLRVLPGTGYGWPDYSTDLVPISDPRFQPPADMLSKSGYQELSSLIDQAASGLVAPDRSSLLVAAFPSLSGAGKLDFVPASGPFKKFRGSAILVMSGDRAPFATNGLPLERPVGYKLVQVNLDTQPAQVKDFVRNTAGVPASKMGNALAAVTDALGVAQVALERPIDVKFGPDGNLYILDFGRMDVKEGKTRLTPRTGRIFRLVPTPPPPPPTTASTRASASAVAK